MHALPACSVNGTTKMTFVKEFSAEKREITHLDGEYEGYTKADFRSRCVSTLRANGRCRLIQDGFQRLLLTDVSECETQCLQQDACTHYSFTPGECLLILGPCPSIQTIQEVDGEAVKLKHITYSVAKTFDETATCKLNMWVSNGRFRLDIYDCGGDRHDAYTCRQSPQEGNIQGTIKFVHACPEGSVFEKPPCGLQDSRTRFTYYYYQPFVLEVDKSYSALAPHAVYAGLYTFNTADVASYQNPPVVYTYTITMFIPSIVPPSKIVELSDVVFPMIDQPAAAQVLNLRRSLSNFRIPPAKPNQNMLDQVILDRHVQLYLECNESLTEFVQNSSWAAEEACQRLLPSLRVLDRISPFSPDEAACSNVCFERMREALKGAAQACANAWKRCDGFCFGQPAPPLNLASVGIDPRTIMARRILEKLVHVSDIIHGMDTACIKNNAGASCAGRSLASVLNLEPGVRCAPNPLGLAQGLASALSSESARNSPFILGNCSDLCDFSSMNEVIVQNGCCLQVHQDADDAWWTAMAQDFDYEVEWGHYTGRGRTVLRQPSLECATTAANEPVLPGCFVIR